MALMMSASLISPLASIRDFGVFVGLAAESHQDVSHGLFEKLILVLVASFEVGEELAAFLIEGVGQADEAVGFFVIHGAHVGLGDGGDGAQDGFFSATGAGSVAADESLVISPHHEVISQCRRTGILRGVILVETEIFLRGVGQESGKNLGAGEFVIEFLGVGNHDQGFVIAALLDAFAAAFAEVADENGKHAAFDRVSFSRRI